MSTALVLSGGGARGAYATGVVAGIVEVLGPESKHAFDMIAGTSVGAINATYLAAQSDQPDLGIEQLITLWTDLSLREYLRPNRRVIATRALLDVRPFERIVRDGVDWQRLHRLVDTNKLQALLIAALHIDSGRTAIFTHLSPQTTFIPSIDPSRVAVRGPITSEHVLASAAIPGVFPPRRIQGKGLFYDGGLRFNTPISPALRAGAKRLVVVSPLHKTMERGPPTSLTPNDRPPDPLFLAGKMLHAVLLDSFAYDLSVLHRFNALLEVLDETLPTEARTRFDHEVAALRGRAYRAVQTLVFSPSKDLGRMALQFVAANRRSFLRQGLGGIGVALASRRLERSGTDLVSYLLFDGRFTSKLIDLGRRDAVARADEIRTFFRR